MVIPYFPIQFVPIRGETDLYARAVNFAGNALVVAGVVILTTAVATAVLKAIGLGIVADVILTTAHLSFSLMGVTGTVLAASVLTYLLIKTSTERPFFFLEGDRISSIFRWKPSP